MVVRLGGTAHRAKVNELHIQIKVDQDVLVLDVAMEDAMPVEVRNSISHLKHRKQHNNDPRGRGEAEMT